MNDQSLNIRFVEEVKKHELLYNYNLPEYSRKDLTEKAWREVGAEVNMTGLECKEKWRNLRTVFMRKKKTPPNGYSRNKRPYYLAESMEFCLPFIKGLARPTTENFPQPSETDTAAGILEDALRWDDDSDSIDLVSALKPSYSPSPKRTIATLSQAQPISVGRVTKNRTSEDKSAVDTDKCVAEYFKAKKAKLEASANKFLTADSHNVERKEAIRMFLLSLMPEVEEFSDAQIKLFKRKVFSVIDDISSLAHLQ